MSMFQKMKDEDAARAAERAQQVTNGTAPPPQPAPATKAAPSELCARFAKLFAGLQRAYGTYEVHGSKANGKLEGRAATHRDEVTLALYRKHLDGEQGLGVIPIMDDGNVWFGVIDDDDYQKAFERVARVKELGLPIVPCLSKSDGIHHFVFFREPAPAAAVRRALKIIAAKLGMPESVEVFPKQDALRPDECGNWINLPYFRGALGPQQAERLCVRPDTKAKVASLEAFLNLAESMRITLAQLEAGANRVIQPGVVSREQTAGYTEGGRNSALTSEAGRLRQLGMNEDEVEAALQAINANRCDPPLSAAEVKRIARSVARYEAPEPEGRTLIQIKAGEQPAALAALKSLMIQHAEDLSLMVYAGAITHPHLVPRRGYQGEEVLSLELNRLSPGALGAKLNRVAEFRMLQRTKTGWVSTRVDCPTGLVRVFQELPEDWGGLPRIERITETPIFIDGQLISRAGYCAPAAAWINAPRIELKKLSKESAQACLSRVLEWLAEFAFETEVDRSVAVCALMTAALRASVPHAPAILIDKPDFGAGASTLAKLVHVVLTGRYPSVTSIEKKNEEELRKHIDSIQTEGRASIVLDNVEKGTTLKSMALSQVLTEPERSIRILGHTRTVSVACVQLVLMTGVNTGVAEDLVRRFIRCRLNPKCERPQERVFARPALLDEAQARRVELLSDLYTIAAACCASGEKIEVTSINGFRHWLDWCVRPLVWLGMQDPVQSQRALESNDEDRASLGEILHLWHQRHGSNRVTVKELLRWDGGEPDELRSLLLAQVGDRGADSSAAVGRYLAGARERIVDGYQLRRVKSKTDGVQRWRVLRDGDDAHEAVAPRYASAVF